MGRPRSSPGLVQKALKGLGEPSLLTALKKAILQEKASLKGRKNKLELKKAADNIELIMNESCNDHDESHG